MEQPSHAKDYTRLPPNLPVPQDDGAADHLTGRELPGIELPSTSGRSIRLDQLPGRLSVIYCYPMTGRPGVPLPAGWDLIPGARGCTPQSCVFRDRYAELKQLGAEIFGLSTQSHEEQCEAGERLHLPFQLLSDERMGLTNALDLPTFDVEGRRLLKRLTMIVRDQRIAKVFYPVFPPDRSAEQVLSYLSAE